MVVGLNSPVIDYECALTTLRDSWAQTTQRQRTDDSKWHSDLVQYLTHLVDLRVAHVKDWLESNVQRFEGEHASIEELWRTFDGAVINLRASVELCQSQCGSCNLICVQGSRSHKADHDCFTNHRCIHSCSVCERESRPKQHCGQAYVRSSSVLRLSWLTYDECSALAIQEIICEFRTHYPPPWSSFAHVTLVAMLGFIFAENLANSQDRGRVRRLV